jgi:hypothetical protein
MIEYKIIEHLTVDEAEAKKSFPNAFNAQGECIKFYEKMGWFMLRIEMWPPQMWDDHGQYFIEFTKQHNAK